MYGSVVEVLVKLANYPVVDIVEDTFSLCSYFYIDNIHDFMNKISQQNLRL